MARRLLNLQSLDPFDDEPCRWCDHLCVKGFCLECGALRLPQDVAPDGQLTEAEMAVGWERPDEDVIEPLSPFYPGYVVAEWMPGYVKPSKKSFNLEWL